MKKQKMAAVAPQTQTAPAVAQGRTNTLRHKRRATISKDAIMDSFPGIWCVRDASGSPVALGGHPLAAGAITGIWHRPLADGLTVTWYLDIKEPIREAFRREFSEFHRQIRSAQE